MQFIFQYPDAHGTDVDFLDPGPIAEVARTAERAGFDGFALTDHPAPSASWLEAGGHQTLDPLIALGHAAAVTERLRLLTYLAVLPYRNPLALAKAATTLDRLSGGRFVLGAGTGYLKAEYFALGVDFDERNELFDEALEVLPKAWSGEPFDHQGRHFSARNTIQRPAPGGPIPIWFGGNAKRTLRRVAQHGQGWMPLISSAEMSTTVRSAHIGSLEALAPRLELLRDFAGDRFDDLEIAVAYTDRTIHSPELDAERHRDAIGTFEAAGVTTLIVPGPRGTHPGTTEFLDGFGTAYLGDRRDR